MRVLVSEGFSVTHVDGGKDALAAVERSRPDLVLLDLTLPDIDGLDVCRKLRAEVPDLPIVMLTARAEEMDVIVGLGAGADDYIAKPFRLAELIARVRARLRVVEQATRATPMLEGAGLRVDRDAPAHVHGRSRGRADIEGVRSARALDESSGRHVHPRADHEPGVGRALVGIDTHTRHPRVDAAQEDW